MHGVFTPIIPKGSFLNFVKPTEVNGVKNCDSILPYFDKYVLYSKKKESYELWKELRLQLIKGDHLNSNTRIIMKELANKINKIK